MLSATVIFSTIAAMLIYFTPTFIAIKKKNLRLVFLTNLLLGWTLIGWIAAMVWAMRGEAPEVPERFKKNRNDRELEEAFLN